MRRLLLSDIHANMEAMDACLARSDEAGFDSVICCGDIVGYGPEPNEAVEKLKALKAVSIRGNHDRVACGQVEPTGFNPHAKAAAFWTRDTLIEQNHAYLRALPVGPLHIGEGAQLVHGSVTDEDDYIMSESHAAESFALTETHLTFFGHSHHPAVYTCDRSGNIVEELQKNGEDLITTHLRNDMRYLINPGSVGQSRDGNTRSAFLIWDSYELRLEFYRAEYPVEVTQEKMEKVGLPRCLIERLTYGR
jgi:predicted phosphodiesterase